MDACRRLIARFANTLVRAVVFACAIAVGAAVSLADETREVIRLPEWVDPTLDLGARPATFHAAPRPRLPIETKAAEPRALPDPLPLAADPRPVRQLEHAASEARGEHALTRVIERYRETRQGLTEADSRELVARADRVGSWALHARGRSRSERGDRAAALTDYRNAVRLDPSNTGALHDLGIGLADQGKNDEALAAFNSVLRRQPGSPAALRNRASVLLRTGEAGAAVRDCDRALRGQDSGTPDYVATLALRGSALHAVGRLREAAMDLDAVLRYQPQDAKARVARGHVFAEAGFYDQAIADYVAALQNDASSVEAYRSLAWVLATCPEPRLRDPATAIEAAWRARRLLGDDDERTLDASAAAHAAAGEFGEAIRLQQRLLMVMAGRSEAPVRAAERRLDDYKAGRPHVATNTTARR